MSLNPYLSFDGQCRAAFELYRSVFGGAFTEFQTYAEAPAEMPVADAERDRVMHVSLPVGDGILMGCDRVAGAGMPHVVGNNVTIAIVGRSRAHCDEVCRGLSEGGSVTMPLQETFWGAYFGSWTDRFGINWIVNYTLPAS